MGVKNPACACAYVNSWWLRLEKTTLRTHGFMSLMGRMCTFSASFSPNPHTLWCNEAASLQQFPLLHQWEWNVNWIKCAGVKTQQKLLRVFRKWVSRYKPWGDYWGCEVQFIDSYPVFHKHVQFFLRFLLEFILDKYQIIRYTLYIFLEVVTNESTIRTLCGLQNTSSWKQTMKGNGFTRSSLCL